MKKSIAVLLSVVMIFAMIIPAYAVGFTNAKNYKFGVAQSGQISESNQNSVYKITLDQAGTINLNFGADTTNLTIRLYDADGNKLVSESPRWNSTTQELRYQNSWCLNKGVYYFSIERSYYDGSYVFTITQEPIHESFPESGDTNDNNTKNANNILLNQKYTGCISITDSVDVYRLELASSGDLNLSLSAKMQRVYVKLYDMNGQQLWYEYPYWNSTTEEISYQTTLSLNKGVYYISVSLYSGYGYGEYSFELTHTSGREFFVESQTKNNNKLNLADVVDINTRYAGFIAMNDNVDFYKIDLSVDRSYELDFTANMRQIYIRLYDETGSQLWYEYPRWNSTTEEISYRKTVQLSKGTYYLAISRYSDTYTGTYSFYLTDGGAITDAVPPISVTVDGKSLDFDQPPLIENGRTLVPLRAIFEALGATVNWNGTTQTVTASKNDVQISLQINSTQMYVNGVAKTLDVPAKIINSRTLVPLRAISEAFGCFVNWNGSDKSITIASK